MNLKERALYTASLVLFVVAIYAYLYESRSTGLVPVVTYPFRINAIPIALTGLVLLVLAFIARKFSPEAYPRLRIKPQLVAIDLGLLYWLF